MASKSQNGWPVLDGGSKRLHTWVIPAKNGTFKLKLRSGSGGFLLAHLALFYSEEIEDVTKSKVLDDWGWAPARPVRGQTTGFSNHASGTAIDLNATIHVLGKHKTGVFKDPKKSAKLRARLRSMKGVIRWGGDYTKRKDEMHFEIVQDITYCEREARRLMDSVRGKRLLEANPSQKKVILS